MRRKTETWNTTGHEDMSSSFVEDMPVTHAEMALSLGLCRVCRLVVAGRFSRVLKACEGFPVVWSRPKRRLVAEQVQRGSGRASWPRAEMAGSNLGGAIFPDSG